MESPLPDLKTLYAYLGRWPGYLDSKQAQGLYNFLQSLEPCTIVEIGPYAGRATAFCGTVAKAVGHTYSLLDDWSNLHPQCRALLTRAKLLYKLDPIEFDTPPDADVVIVTSGKVEQVKGWLGHCPEAEIVFLRHDLEVELVGALELMGGLESGLMVYTFPPRVEAVPEVTPLVEETVVRAL